jgi:hypothetical protein
MVRMLCFDVMKTHPLVENLDVKLIVQSNTQLFPHLASSLQYQFFYT